MKQAISQLKSPLPAPGDEPADRPAHLHDRAFAYLKGLLLDGGLEPGDVISTEEVARTLGISRAPATDAIKRLTADGFFVVLPQIGCRVPSPRQDEVADFYELFAASEAVITRFAALRRTPEQANAFGRLIGELQDKSARLRSVPTASAALRMLNRVRHEALHKIAGSPIAADLVAGMWDRSDFYIRLAFGSFVVNAAVRHAQHQIADAVIAGDARTAEKQTRDYLCAVGKAAAGQMRKALRR